MDSIADSADRLQNLICDIQREPKHIKKRALKDALKLLHRDSHPGTVTKLLMESIWHIGSRYTCRAVLKMPDSVIRNEAILSFISLWCTDSFNYVWEMTISSMARRVLRSEFALPEQIRKAVSFYPQYARKAMKPALMCAAEEKPGSTSLLMYLASSNKLKKDERLKLAGAVLGMESATMHDLMEIVRNFPELRDNAAAIALTRSHLLQPQDLKLLCAFDSTREMARIMLDY